MHFQVIFNGIWKEFQLVLEGILIDVGWISMLFGWSAMHFGWISNACSMDFQLCCLVVGMLSSLREIEKESDPGEIVHLSGMVLPSGYCLVIGILSSLWGIKKTSEPGEIVHLSGMVLPSGCCLVVGMLACGMHFEWVSNVSP